MMIKSKVGVIGGGQLAWMMAKVAANLDIELMVQTPSKDDPAVSLATKVILAPIDDPQATAKLASSCDVITFENEFVDLQALQKLADRGVCFRPSLTSLSPLLDKYHQRCFLRDMGLSMPKFNDFKANVVVTSLPPFLKEQKIAFPLVVKTRRHGYDGQGTIIVKTEAELKSTLKNFQGVDLLVEEFIPFERELAVIAARSVAGEMIIYPPGETYQKNQVCHWVIAPVNLTPKQNQKIKDIASQLLTKLDYVGVLGIELFLGKDGQILVNEIAPRTHNSGHYTLDACETSQFAMQLQTITGKPLGDISLKTDGVVMVNLLGYEYSNSEYHYKREQILKIENAHLHWYGKTECRPGRKLGHVTVLFNLKNQENIREKGQLIAEKIESIWYH
jgi:5-(carboxyamino)imidazole ribonucleotide synthase